MFSLNSKIQLTSNDSDCLAKSFICENHFIEDNEPIQINKVTQITALNLYLFSIPRVSVRLWKMVGDKWNITCHVSKQRISQLFAIAANFR